MEQHEWTKGGAIGVLTTTEDWIRRAQQGGDVASCLAHARSAARRPEDWIALASEWMHRSEVASARQCIETALELARGEHWPCRRAAEFLLSQLGDREAAAVALGHIESRLLSPTAGLPTQAYQWVLLARAYQELLGQTSSVHRCLARASADASGPEDLAALAEGHARLRDDLETARQLLERAEKLARERGDSRRLWTVAVGWKTSLHDPARARATLEAATTGASDIPTLTSLTVAWRSLFDDEEALRGTLARGETLATSPDDWLVLAEGYRDGGQGERESTWDPPGVRRCLEAALTATPLPTEAQRERLAVAFRRWLGDSARAAELVPGTRSLESRVMPVRHIEGWKTREPLALLHRLRERMGPEDLEVIANADYGNDWGKHHQALLEIHASDTFPLPLDWYPREVLALTRWTRGVDTPHVRRAFACTVLVLDAALPDSDQACELEHTLGALLESAWALGLEDELEGLLVWLVEVIAWEYQYPWALLALVLALARRAPGDPRLGPLVAQFQKWENTDLDMEALVRAATSRWWDSWRSIIAEVLDPEKGLPAPLEWLAIHLL